MSKAEIANAKLLVATISDVQNSGVYTLEI